MIREEDIIELLKDQVKPALGCTEPVAVAIAVSRAYKEVGGHIKSIDVLTSPNIYKNGMRVGIPGTSEKGLYIAVALAVVCGDWELGLEVFKNIKDKDVSDAKTLLSLGAVSLRTNYNTPASFYIMAEVVTDIGTCKCIIEGSHTNITLVEKNGDIIYKKDTAQLGSRQSLVSIKDLSIQELINLIERIPFEKLKFLLKGAELNTNIAKEGLSNGNGANLGAKLQKMIDSGIIAEDMVNKARVMTAAASDARMSGINMPVMSSAGSGNHGLTAILPVVIVAREMNCSEERLVRALAISHVVTIYIKEYTGKLSPICGCSIAAGVGASASIAWLIGCSEEQVTGAIMNMIGNLAGMICDGAKQGCALKLSTAAAEAIISAQLAKNGLAIPNFDGIVGNNAELTIKNLGRLCVEGMNGIDEKIIDIMSSNDVAADSIC